MKNIEIENYDLHEAHCTRFLYLCDICNEVVKKSDKEHHISKYHQKSDCKFCFQSFFPTELVLHESICNAKGIQCLYCGAVYELSILINHEDMCGNRTEKCGICNKFVILKSLENHQDMCIKSLEKSPKNYKRKPENDNPSKPSLKHSKKK